MELIPGVTKEDYSDYVLYYIENFSDELKSEIRSRLVSICHGAEHAQSTRVIYSYKYTLKEFIKRYKTNQDASENRKKGMIGELLVHVILEIEGRFTVASPFFNMEERSFKKGFDIALFDSKTEELWITEVKSGNKQKSQATASSAIVGLINTAKDDLNRRLNDHNVTLWYNAINAATLSMNSGTHQKDALIKLLQDSADNVADESNSSDMFNVVLSGMLFHPMHERMETSVYKGYKQDKIEMRGDRAEMSDFPLYLNTVAGGLDCRDQTIGGFSFVVKIYAVPVVEIIG